LIAYIENERYRTIGVYIFLFILQDNPAKEPKLITKVMKHANIDFPHKKARKIHNIL